MKFHLDRILREAAQNAYDHAVEHLPEKPNRDKIVGSLLYELEAIGHAMRYRAKHGGVAWKAALRLLTIIADMEADARAELQHAREARGPLLNR